MPVPSFPFEVVVEQVGYHPATVVLVDAGPLVAQMRPRTNELPGVDIVAPKPSKGLPWWAWVAIVGAGGRAAKLW